MECGCRYKASQSSGISLTARIIILTTTYTNSEFGLYFFRFSEQGLFKSYLLNLLCGAGDFGKTWFVCGQHEI
jgi:hypothetical protein